MKIDVFNHIITPKYHQRRMKVAPPGLRLQDDERRLPTLFDHDARLRVMEAAGEGDVQISTTATPPGENMAGPEDALELSRIANDEMAELVSRLPSRFLGAAACLPMNNPQGTLDELDRAVRQLGLCAVQIYTDVQGRPLDDPAFSPVFDKIVELDIPILLHPVRGPDRADYPTEHSSRFDTWRIIGWPYDTVAAMTRLAFSGIFDRHPNIKIVTHHLGGVAPYLSERIREGYDKLLKAARIANEPVPLTKHPHDYFHEFYADTITIGSVPARACGLEFFGADRVLFATDMPFDTEGGLKYVEVALEAMEKLDAPASDKEKIFELNARTIFRLPSRST
jgi:predicted TIM-barrel fold metal-dependent hydrolase